MNGLSNLLNLREKLTFTNFVALSQKMPKREMPQTKLVEVKMQR